MISRQLIRTDLNLLVCLQVLIEERNVTRAAERLSVSQPALSKTLQRLRDAFADELFTRTAHGLVPTPRAEVLATELPAVLAGIDQVLGREDFSPASYEGSFRILLPPIVSETLLPGLMKEMAEMAPGITLITAGVASNYQELLKKGKADFAIFVPIDIERDIHAEPIKTVAPRCYLRRQHPLANTNLSLSDFLSQPHVRLYLPGLARENASMVDDVLGQYGKHRKVVLETTQFAPAVGVVAATDALLVANAGFEETGLFSSLIIGKPLPEELQRMIRNTNSGNRGKMSLMRHTRTARSAPHQWMRSLLMSQLSQSTNLVADREVTAA